MEHRLNIKHFTSEPNRMGKWQVLSKAVAHLNIHLLAFTHTHMCVA